MKTRQFLSSDGKRTYTATAMHCDCPGFRHRRRCGHTKFMAHPHKLSEIADYEFCKFYFLLI